MLRFSEGMKEGQSKMAKGHTWKREFIEGYNAFEIDMEKSDNPYSEDKHDYDPIKMMRWNRGYNTAEFEAKMNEQGREGWQVNGK